jgi:hypothetical protein
MTNSVTREIGLLRELVPHVVKEIISVDPVVQAYMREQGLTESPSGAGIKTNILPAGHEAFQQLSECITAYSGAIARGTTFESVQEELLALCEGYAGTDPQAITQSDAQKLHEHYAEWFSKRARPRRVFVPCVLSRHPSPDFAIGPVSFFLINEFGAHTFYTPGTMPDALTYQSFDYVLKLMKETRANWLARVEVDGCDQERAEDVGEIAIDLAIVALQLAAPGPQTGTMSRLDSRRGAAEKRIISEADGHYNASWTLMEAGSAIGTGTLAHILKVAAPVVSAVGNTVRGFTSGQFQLPVLQTAWCDAAYWLHQALVEATDSIAVAKVCAENKSGSEARLLAILDSFFGLKPDDPIGPGPKLTAKRFAKNVVSDRSQILHGICSTLNRPLGRSRHSLQQFTMDVLGRAVIALDAYGREPSAKDNVDAILAWVRTQRGGSSAGSQST